jgi:uncharacterized protein (TIGR02001 family)
MNAAAVALLPLLAALLTTGPVEAAEPETGDAGPGLTGGVALTTDYRFRGVTSSNLDPAIQGWLQLDTAPGLYVSLWASSISDYFGATAELDVTAGWTGPIGPLDWDIGLVGYLFPGGDGTDVVELFATASVPLGPLKASLGVAWAPPQRNLASASRYAWAGLEGELPGVPLALRATLGQERGSFVTDETGRSTAKWDWLAGATYSWSALSLDLAYVGTDLARTRLTADDGTTYRANAGGKGGVVLTLSAEF